MQCTKRYGCVSNTNAVQYVRTGYVNPSNPLSEFIQAPGDLDVSIGLLQTDCCKAKCGPVWWNVVISAFETEEMLPLGSTAEVPGESFCATNAFRRPPGSTGSTPTLGPLVRPGSDLKLEVSYGAARHVFDIRSNVNFSVFSESFNVKLLASTARFARRVGGADVIIEQYTPRSIQGTVPQGIENGSFPNFLPVATSSVTAEARYNCDCCHPYNNEFQTFTQTFLEPDLAAGTPALFVIPPDARAVNLATLNPGAVVEFLSDTGSAIPRSSATVGADPLRMLVPGNARILRITGYADTHITPIFELEF